MTLLQNHNRWRGREKLLSKKLAPGSSLKWTPRERSRGASDHPRSLSLSTTENDERGDRANRGTLRTVSPIPDVNPPSTGLSKRIYIDSATICAMKKGVADMFPATLSRICIALQNDDGVLSAHEHALSSRLSNNDDVKMMHMEIMGGSFSKMSISPDKKSEDRSPEQQLKDHREDFRAACLSLVAEGNDVTLRSWDEAKKKLSKIFNFTVVNIEVQPKTEMHAAGSVVPTLRKGKRSSQKVTPKKAHNRSPMKPPRAKMTTKKSILEKAAVTVAELRAMIRRNIGHDKYNQIYKQAEILPEKFAIASDDAAAARLDEKIKQKELKRSQRVDEILAAKEKADKEREAQESASKLMRPLTAEEKQIVVKSTRGIGPEDEILARQEADSVQRGSMQTLRSGQWLNDEVINYFLKNCLAQRDEMLCAKQPGRKRSHFFNSFFVQTMFDEKNNNLKLRGKYNYKNVKRWGKKVPGKDVFNLKYIFCPINLDNMHWTSAAIFMEEKRIQYYDSLGGTQWDKLEGLLQYLKDEYRAKKGGELNGDEWELVGCSKDTPRQTNGFDCGVFTCMFADFISKDCPLVFKQDHINQCRDRIALSIMKNCAIE